MTTSSNQVPYQHLPNVELSHFDKLYEKGSAWNSSGIVALRHADVNPFHVSILDRSSDSPVAVYYLQDNINHEELYWLEGDYKAAFEAFRARVNGSNVHYVRLFVAVLVPQGNAKETFLHSNPFAHSHGGTHHWSDHYQSWQF